MSLMEKKMLKLVKTAQHRGSGQMMFLYNIFKAIIGGIFVVLIKIYQYFISPLTGAACRYTPPVRNMV